MTEYQVYGKDGLFHNIVKQSKIMAGRYAVTPGTADLNRNNVLSGIEFPKAKYPMVLCTTPVSAFDKASVVNHWETFNFQLFFVTTTYNTGDNKLKRPDQMTNSSLHTSPMDWSDMKEVLLSFMAALETMGGVPQLRNEFRLDQKATWVIRRFSHEGNDNVSGVMISFSASLPAPCEYEDIVLNDQKITAILTPSAHPQHYH